MTATSSGYTFRIGVIGSADGDIKPTLKTVLDTIRQSYPRVSLRLVFSGKSPVSFRQAVTEVAEERNLEFEWMDEVNWLNAPGGTLGVMCDAIVLIGANDPVSEGVARDFRQKSNGPVYVFER